MDYIFRPQPAINIATGLLMTVDGVGSVYASPDSTSALTVNVGGVETTEIPIAGGQTALFTGTDTGWVLYFKVGSQVAQLLSLDGFLAVNEELADSAADAALAASDSAAAAALLIEGVVRSVGGFLPDAGGNVVLEGYVKTVNGAPPDSEGNINVSTGTGGGGGGVSDHGALSGLGDDDHAQYLNAGRGDSRYYRKDQTFTQAEVTALVNAVKARSTHTGTQAMGTIVDLEPRMAQRLTVVDVSTGNEARPAGSGKILWVNPLGITPIVNALTTDLIAGGGTGGGGGGDTVEPSTPTGLAFSGVTENSVNLTWAASSDNVGVVGYDVFINGVIRATPTGTSVTVGSLTSATEHTARVRARDAAGNPSGQSTPVTFTTSAASGSPTHSVFGATAYGGRSLGVFTDGTPNIRLAQAFYAAGAGAAGFRCKGGRVYIPAGADVPSTITIMAYQTTGATPDLSTAPLMSETVPVVPGSWAEAIWDSPLPLVTSGTYGNPVWIAYEFPGSGKYFAGGELPTGPTQAGDGSLVFESGRTDPGWRPAFRIGTGATTVSPVNSTYGIDVIVDEG